MLEPYFSNSQITFETIGEADKVAYRWTWTGTHKGELMGIAPTGNQIAITGTSIHRFADGKLVESWVSYDMLGLMQQLTTPEWPIVGTWITTVPIPEGQIIYGNYTVTQQDPEGIHYTSVVHAINPLEPPTFYDIFPEAEHYTTHIGQMKKTGLNTYESTVIGYGTKQPDIPGMLCDIVYISVITGTLQLVDENTMQGQGTHAFYDASADANGDGLPDEGQEPVACFPYAITGRRVLLMPPCVPPVPEPEGE
jgi:hypothetical protein